MMNLLEVKDLQIDFSNGRSWVPAVQNVHFSLKAGKTLAMVGESGSGKTVTSLAILGLLSNLSARVQGEILFQGQNLLGLPESSLQKVRGKQAAMIFQEPMTSLNPVYSVGYQIVESLQLHEGLSKRLAWERTYDLLARVGIEDPRQRGHNYPHQLSGGQRQRVMIAMAIACSPQLLIADEPTTALDVTIQKQILDLLLRIQEEEKMSLLFVTHDLGLVQQLADDILVLRQGQIVEQGPKSQVLHQPTDAYTRALLACRPPLDFRPQRLATLSDFTNPGKNKVPGTEPWQVPRSPQPPVTNEGAPLLEVQGMTKEFVTKRSFWGQALQKVRAVDQVSLVIRKGRTLGLVGESGSGKTTLGRGILRLIEPDEGHVRFKGEDILSLKPAEMRARRRYMQIIFQDPYASLNPRMTIGNAILEPMKVHKPSETKKEREDRMVDLLKRVGLNPDWRDRYPFELSGGQRQRACIARALAVEPEFLICDESVSALDVSIQAQVLNLLADLQEQLGLTYLFISHDLAVVRFMADELAIMKSGRIVESGSAETIYRSPQHSYTQTLLESVPRLSI